MSGDGHPLTTSDDELEQFAARTRRSLIVRLQDWQDRRSWDEFYRTYWRLIYAVATRAGLKDDEAWDVVQETVLTIAKQSRKDLYDPERGSFKSWLLKVTGWRINDRFRKTQRERSLISPEAEPDADHVSSVADMDGVTFEKIWESEWKQNITKAALERVKAKVSPKQYQIFDYVVLREMDTAKVKELLGVSLASIYLAKHRISLQLRKEIEHLKELGEKPLPATPGCGKP